VDAAYVKESILYPNNSIVAGYEPVMTPYEGKVTDKELDAIVAWLKTLSSFTPAEETTQGATVDGDATQQEGN
jgi:cytochrome c oxidase subunit 2